MKKIILTLSLLIAAAGMNQAGAQINKIYGKEGLKIYLSEDSTRYVKATGLAQIWFRYNDNNPGSAIYGTPQKNTFDVGLRRVRYQTLAQITKNVFFYSQFGINSVNSLSARKTGLFFHDVTAEYNVHKNYFVLGGGLSGWNGTSRFSSSSVASILALDLPVVQETTNDVTDQFVRKLGVYAKGKIGAFDYRLSAANPFPVQNALSPMTALPASDSPAAASTTNTAYFSNRAPEMNYQGYFMWQFLDKESNQLPYMNGSYLGKKRVLNLGAGFQHQNNAMTYRKSVTDTSTRFTALRQFGIDIFYDSYIDKDKQNAVTAYISFLNYDFGPNYIRNAGAMNTANGVVGAASFNGAGNAFPLIGTGQVIYAQGAYLFKKDLLKKQGTLQPYVSGMYANYQKLKDPVIVYDIGLNWIMSGQNSKLSLDYQSRPIFNTNANGEISETKSARRGQVVLQYQVAF
ncbi:MAG TPA: hypothetical protein PL029_03720 [Bacteroidia bacterium]|nr:hypothetical protein [Bacteroidia bacterium]